jgi:hypothetical protein
MTEGMVPDGQFTQEMLNNVVQQLAQGKQPARIIKELEKQGWSKENATTLVDQGQQALKAYQESPEGRQAMASKYKRAMLFGVLWTVGGIIATVISVNVASSGGTYFVFWGAVIFGIYDFIRGLIGWLKYRD